MPTTLPQSQRDQLDRLALLCRTSPKRFPAEALAVLGDQYSPPDEKLVCQRLDGLDCADANLFSGALRFYLVCRAADRGDFAAANDLLAARDTKHFIERVYAVPMKYLHDGVWLHRLGTTSYILRTGSPTIALKIIRPRFTQNRTIQRETLEYALRFEGRPGRLTPAIHETGDLFIAMDFVDAPTLSDYLKEIVWPEVVGRNIERVVRIFNMLCLALEDFASKGISHLDLSTMNILVPPEYRDGQKKESICLIDFGRSYVLTGGCPYLS